MHENTISQQTYDPEADDRYCTRETAVVRLVYKPLPLSGLIQQTTN